MGLKEPGLRGSLRNVSVGIRAIPDSAISQYDAQSAFASGDDGTTISAWPDELGLADATGGSPTVRENGINNNRSLEFDAVDDILQTGAYSSAKNQPITIASVFQAFNTDERIRIHDGDSNIFQTEIEPPEYSFSADASTVNGGSPDTNPHIAVAIFDGANSSFRLDGAELFTGDVGSNSLDGFTIGASRIDSLFWDGYLGELVIYDDVLSGEQLSEEEQRLSDKWGVTV